MEGGVKRAFFPGDGQRRAGGRQQPVCLLRLEGKDLQVRLLKVGRKVFCESRRELTKNEYLRLVRAARDSGNERLALLLQTVCSTGIRISELAAITVEAACARSASVDCKGKIRTVFLPEALCRLLRRYADKRGIRSGQTTCATCLPEPTTARRETFCACRTSWGTATSTPPGSIPGRAEQTICAAWSSWDWWWRGRSTTE